MTRLQLFATPLLILTTAALVSGCALRGSGTKMTETREVGAFTGVDVSGAMDVHIEVGADQTIEVSGDDNIVPKVTTTVEGSRLIVSVDANNVRPKLPIELNITVPSLADVDLSGASDLEVTGLHGEKFEVDISGAADAIFAGSVDTFEVDISGAAELDAAELTAKNVELELSGAADAKVHATDTLDVEVSGAGTVEYLGSPTVTKEVSGAATVKAAG